MNADQLREVRERNATLDGCAPMAWSQTESDRAALLAEVDRLTANIEDGSRTNANLRAEVDKLRAFVEKVRDHKIHFGGGPYGGGSMCVLCQALTELRASK